MAKQRLKKKRSPNGLQIQTLSILDYIKFNLSSGF